MLASVACRDGTTFQGHWKAWLWLSFCYHVPHKGASQILMACRVTRHMLSLLRGWRMANLSSSPLAWASPDLCTFISERINQVGLGAVLCMELLKCFSVRVIHHHNHHQGLKHKAIGSALATPESSSQWPPDLAGPGRRGLLALSAPVRSVLAWGGHF